MKRFISFLLIFVLCILIYSTTLAATVTMNYNGALDGTWKKLKINGKNKNWYTGLYEFEVDGVSWNSYCIDPFNQTSNPWQADYFDAADVALGNGKLFSYPGGVTSGITLEKYRMINWLYNSYGLDEEVGLKTQRSNLSLAFWEISYDYDGTLGSLNVATSHGNFFVRNSESYGDANSWLTQAWNYRSTYRLPNLYTPDPLTASQEILAPPTSPVPEPGTILLLGSGLLGLALYARFRNRRT